MAIKDGFFLRCLMCAESFISSLPNFSLLDLFVGFELCLDLENARCAMMSATIVSDCK